MPLPHPLQAEILFLAPLLSSSSCGRVFQSCFCHSGVEVLAVVATSTIVSRSSDNAYFKLPKDKNHLELLLKNRAGTSLVIQWLRICLPMQGMWVLYLVMEPRFHMPLGK